MKQNVIIRNKISLLLLLFLSEPRRAHLRLCAWAEELLQLFIYLFDLFISLFLTWHAHSRKSHPLLRYD